MDHPRIRGEHFIKYGIVPSSEGSSPHTRGALSPAPQGRKTRRIIPAYAGSTADIIIFRSIAADHPRIRGEHGQLARDRDEIPGSSPHTRGAHADLSRRRDACRIIPAYAGSTFFARYGYACNRDHPRIRGEHIARRPAAARLPGSSPHTRGAPKASWQKDAALGIIPAYAGSTP